jgi:hypothetical protein
MSKQTNRFGPSPARRAMGLRRGAARKPTPMSRNDHIHLFSTEANARRLREALQQVDEGRVHWMPVEELCARVRMSER